MTNQEQRIRLAEAVGWTDIDWCFDRNCEVGVMPGGDPDDVDDYQPLPDPKNNATDCDDLIGWLNENYFISATVTRWAKYGDSPHPDRPHKCGVRFDHVNGVSKEWTGDDWKHGVVELALKILDED